MDGKSDDLKSGKPMMSRGSVPSALAMFTEGFVISTQSLPGRLM